MLRLELMSTRPGCGAGGARRSGAVIPLLPMGGPRRRPREREAGAFWKERSRNLVLSAGPPLRAREERLTAVCICLPGDKMKRRILPEPVRLDKPYAPRGLSI